ncbi:MAG: SLBB domain-containing protein [Reichenbachiella sp.]
MRRIFRLWVIATVLLSSLPQLSYGQQSPSLQNIATVNVDKLSDAQIKQFVKKVESSGYTEDQLIMMAKSRGMSEMQVQKLRSRIAKLESGSSSVISQESLNRVREENTVSTISQDPFGSFKIDSTGYLNGLPIFGLKFFENTQLTFEPGLNMPTPTNYVLGPGDEIIIDIWGASEQTYQLMVSPEGAIRIPSLGPIYVNGLTVEVAKGKIISRLKKIYSTIGRGSNADVTLGQIRSIGIHVIGAVKIPGTYKLSSFGTAFNALYSAGGPNEKGSLRKIEIYRSRELISTLDAYAFLIRGTGENITLQDQDVIIIRPYENRIIFDGEVKHPAVYEMIEGETMDDLLLYSGGYTNQAYKGVVNLRRVEGNFKTVKSIEPNDPAAVALFNGDEIKVGKITNEFINRVTIEGPVLNPGEFELQEGMSLLKLIEQADGFRGDAYMGRGVIIRQNSDFSLSSIMFNPTKVLNGNEEIVLQSNDVIKLQSIYDLKEDYNLVVRGEVQNPGTFAYVKGITVKDLIFLSGGFNESAAKSFIEVARRIDPDSAKDTNSIAEIFNFPISEELLVSKEDAFFELQPYDLVVIRKSPFYNDQEFVEIEGEVNFPGTYVLDRKDERISSVLNRAGGATDFAYIKGATLIRKSEYYKKNSEDPGYANDAVRVRKQDLTEIFRKDTLFTNEESIFKQEEAIGIDLEKIFSNPGSEDDMIMRKGDILSIPRQLQTVRVRGNVLYPSNVRYNGNNLKSYVSSAGGFDQQAKKSKSYVIYANGSAAQTKSFLGIKNYPKIERGTEIVIPVKPSREPMSPQVWMALASTMATIALVVSQIVK